MEKQDESLPKKINIYSNISFNITISNSKNSLSYNTIGYLNSNDNNNQIETNISNNNIRNEDIVNLSEKPKHYNERHFGNIGNNIVLFNKYVFGQKNSLWLLILIMVAIAISFYLYLVFIGDFYSIFDRIFYACFLSN